MTVFVIAILLFALGLTLLVAEFFIPAHGVTAGLGLLALLSGVIACFFVGEWVGLTALVAGAVLAPVAAAGGMRVFPRTWLGRHIVLPPTTRPGGLAAAVKAAPVRIGQTGITLSALRPSGICEFEDLRSPETVEGRGAVATVPLRIQAISDFGDIAPGSRVRVICFADGRATVRAV